MAKKPAKTKAKSQREIMPLGDRFIVEAIAPDTTTPGGIVLPDAAKDQPVRGTIVAVPKGALSETGRQIKVGDVVIFEGGVLLEHEGRKLLILNGEDLLAKV